MNTDQRVIITPGGPYFVIGRIPVVRMVQVVSAYGEPYGWKDEGGWEPAECYTLCRCGNSRDKPFCDGTHCRVGFGGLETAEQRPIASRQITLPGSRQVIVRRDDSLCIQAGFCANRLSKIDDLVLAADNPAVRSQVIAMVELCPSGALTYALAPGEADIEPELPNQVAVTREITSEGLIRGSLWVTGGVLVERSDGQLLERRNRVTLCCCGRSENKPYCDGTHRCLSEGNGVARRRSH